MYKGTRYTGHSYTADVQSPYACQSSREAQWRQGGGTKVWRELLCLNSGRDGSVSGGNAAKTTSWKLGIDLGDGLAPSVDMPQGHEPLRLASMAAHA